MAGATSGADLPASVAGSSSRLRRRRYLHTGCLDIQDHRETLWQVRTVTPRPAAVLSSRRFKSRSGFFYLLTLYFYYSFIDVGSGGPLRFFRRGNKRGNSAWHTGAAAIRIRSFPLRLFRAVHLLRVTRG